MRIGCWVLVATMVCVFLSAGCSTTLSRNTAYNPQRAVIYGRFFMEKFDGYWLLLRVKNTDTNDIYECEFDPDYKEGLLGHCVRPGNYLVDEVFVRKNNVEIDERGIKKIAYSVFKKYATPFRVESGKAYYIGDYYGVSQTASWSARKVMLQTFLRVEEFSWTLSRVEDNYETSTADFKKRFVNFKDVETVRVFQ